MARDGSESGAPRRGLPSLAARICAEVRAPARLVAHLSLVHDVACELVVAITSRWPGVVVDGERVALGAALHDVGKVVHPEELTGPGSRHEAAGERLLLERGVPAGVARLARTHGAAWEDPESGVEDLVVALADKLWKGVRQEELELALARRIASATGTPAWEVWSWLDEVAAGVCAGAEARLVWQARAG